MIRAVKSILPFAYPDRLWSGDSDDVIALHRPDGRLTRVSESVRHLLGHTPEDLNQKSLTNMLAPADRARVMSLFAEVAEKGSKGRTECRFLTADGRVRWTEIAVSADRAGRIRSIIRDITDRRQRDLALHAARDKAETEADSRAGYLADLSHEIRTPLSAMIGFADMMRNETFGPVGHDKYAEYADLIHKSGEHLLSLVSDLLDMAKLEAGKFTLDKEPVDLQNLITDCVEISRLGAETAGLDLNADIARDLPAVVVDARAVRQILLNLLSNAIKFTRQGGITVRLRYDEDHLWLSVSDTGIGMSREAQQRIGARFAQAHKEGVRGAKGTGLGLALCHALTELHHGEMRLVSEEGTGTRVSVCLPRIDAPDADAATKDDAFAALATALDTQLSTEKMAG
ncbi:PAS domain-containing sensor histidine kinase [Parvularcula sp. IMCC14364]|uniref:sensor histidine kinase n=1 Tax=Parvularcula sp. IMCC14364 TaxID=3067902 RepID=UPI002742843C|nr:PAS domain-containing sensor histidine kinase [Parvularcula sp. IMCC14364]